MVSILNDPACEISVHNEYFGHPIEMGMIPSGPRNAIVAHGISPALQNTRVTWAIGAPAGRVLMRPMNRLNSTPSGPGYEIVSAEGGGFGATVVAADVRNCHSFEGGARACGRELFVTAPTDGPTASGAVYWYQSQTYSPNEPEFVLGGKLTPSFGGRRFGTAIAVSERVHDLSQPWNPAPATVPWVAVSSVPAVGWGLALVDIFSVDPTVDHPLSLVPTLHNPSSAYRFGERLAVGDFDGDGFDDLAVTWRPAFDEPGRVRVYWGQAGPMPLNASAYTEVVGDAVYAFGSPEVEDLDPLAPAKPTFGFSIAAGRFVVLDRDDLVVGVPGAKRDRGAVCQLRFHPSTRALMSSSCVDNPLLGANVGDRFGHSVAVGDVYPVDVALAFDSDAAKLAEVVVGAPGFNSRGTVLAFNTVLGDGIDSVSLRARIDNDVSTVPGWGNDLATGYVQATPWRDIAFRCGDCEPARASHLTRARLPVDETGCPNPSGTWSIVDDSGLARTVRISVAGGVPGAVSTRVVFVTDFDVALYHDGGTGAIATVGPDADEVRGTIPAGTILFADEAGDCVDGVRTVSGFPADVLAVPMLDPIGAWDAIGHFGRNLILNNSVHITFAIVDPGAPNPALITMDFDVTDITGNMFAGLHPNYNVKDADIKPYSGVNLNNSFRQGVCE